MAPAQIFQNNFCKKQICSLVIEYMSSKDMSPPALLVKKPLVKPVLFQLSSVRWFCGSHLATKSDNLRSVPRIYTMAEESIISVKMHLLG